MWETEDYYSIERQRESIPIVIDHDASKELIHISAHHSSHDDSFHKLWSVTTSKAKEDDSHPSTDGDCIVQAGICLRNLDAAQYRRNCHGDG